MHALFITLLTAVPFGALVGAHKTESRSRHRNLARQSAVTNKTYILQDFYQADDFFTYASVLHVLRLVIQPFPGNGHSFLAQTPRKAMPTTWICKMQRPRDLHMSMTATIPPSLLSTRGVPSPLVGTAIREALRSLDHVSVDERILLCSVRITSNKNYTGGLFILDALAMPVGCGTWPSFWVCRLSFICIHHG